MREAVRKSRRTDQLNKSPWCQAVLVGQVLQADREVLAFQVVHEVHLNRDHPRRLSNLPQTRITHGLFTDTSEHIRFFLLFSFLFSTF